MALIVKKVGKVSVKMGDLLTTFRKDHGEGIGSFGGALVNTRRIPTGLFPLDLALGGGFPRGKVSIILGPESSSKTNTALLAIANHQKMFPEFLCAFIDVEHSFDPEWATLLGVDVARLLVIQPDYAEQAVDIIESLLYAEDCGLVVVDSLAALVTSSEMESSADKAVVGGAALVIGKLTRKSTVALSQAEKQGRYPTLIYINQISYKIGVMFGNPETSPGGMKPRYQASIILRVYGKNIMDNQVSKVMPVMKEVNFVLKKWKVPILSAEGTFVMSTAYHSGLKPGQCDDWSAIKGYLEAYGMFSKGPKDKGWIIVGDHYAKQSDFQTKLFQEPAFGNEIRQAIIERTLKESNLLMEGDHA